MSTSSLTMKTLVLYVPISGAATLIMGCGQPEPPPSPPSPTPAKIEVPSETSPTTPGESPTAVAGLQGKWTHTLPGNEGAERRVVLKYVKDPDGPERFEIVQHDWPDKPVFVEKITKGKETELHFKMVSATDESQTTSRTLRYVLHEEQGAWAGTLFESWTETPYSVALTKTE